MYRFLEESKMPVRWNPEWNKCTGARVNSWKQIYALINRLPTPCSTEWTKHTSSELPLKKPQPQKIFDCFTKLEWRLTTTPTNAGFAISSPSSPRHVSRVRKRPNEGVLDHRCLDYDVDLLYRLYLSICMVVIWSWGWSQLVAIVGKRLQSPQRCARYPWKE